MRECPIIAALMCPAASCGVSCWCLKSIRVGTRRLTSSLISSNPRSSQGETTVTAAVECGTETRSIPSVILLATRASSAIAVTSYRPLCSVDKLNDWVMAFLIESGYQWDYCVPALLPSLHARGQCALGSGVPDVVPQRRLR